MLKKKIWASFQSSKNMGLGSGIRDPWSGKKPIPDPGSGSRVKKAPDPGSATEQKPRGVDEWWGLTDLRQWRGSIHSRRSWGQRSGPSGRGSWPRCSPPSGPRSWCSRQLFPSPPAGLLTQVSVILLLFCTKMGSVSDPYSFDTDPDLAFLAQYRSGSGSNLDPGFRWPKIKKNLQLKKHSNIFGSKTTIYLSLGLHIWRASYRRSL